MFINCHEFEIRIITKVMTILVILFLLVIQTFSMNYTEIKLLQNFKNFEKVIFKNDFQLAFFYGPNNSIADVYQPYNWLKIQNQAFTNFPFGPNTMEIYTDLQGRTSLLFASRDGKIKKRSFVTGGAIDTSLWTITAELNNITRASPSSDSSMYLAYCEEGKIVYIGNLTNQNLIYTLNYEDKGVIVSAKWRPGTSQILVSLQNNSSETHFLELFDISTKAKLDLTPITQSTVVDFAFNPNGLTLYFIEKQEMEQTIQTYDMINAIVSDFDTFQGENILGLAVHNNFLTCYQEISVHVWDLISSQYLGFYPSSMKSSGLSPDGSTLITIGSQSAMYVLSLCSPTQYYAPELDSCQDCKKPCERCFSSATRCSLCIEDQYLLQNFTCAACIPNCKDCKDSTTCMVCHDGYYFDGEKCSFCSKALQGCELCMYSSICLHCDSKNHWIMKPNHTCQCMERYTKENQTHCQDCPKNCLVCSSPSFCKGCDPAANRKANSSGFCVCVDGSYQQNDTCIFCNSVLSNCLACESAEVCDLCQEGYNLNQKTSRCELIDGGNDGKIIIIIVGVVVVLGAVGVLAWRIIKKRRSARSTLLQTSLQDYQKVES